MTTRKEAPHESDLHSAMSRKDKAQGALKGAVIGSLLGRIATHGRGNFAHAAGMGYGGVLGATAGVTAGRFKGDERILKDVTTQERKMKHAHDAKRQGFDDTIKESGVLDTIGKGVVGGASSLAAKMGPKAGLTGMGLLHKATQAAGGAEKLHKIVGAGTLAAGGLAGAGLVAGRASR